MQKLELVFKTPTAEIDKNGKPVIKFVETKETAIVASTKSQNNLIEEMQTQGKVATEVKVTEIYIDKKETEKVIFEMVSTQIKDKELQKPLTEHIIKALDGACVFKKPPVIRAKN